MVNFKPPIGAVITLTTRYKNDYILSDEEWSYVTHKDVTVLSPEPWMKSDEIKVSSDTKRMPFRVIKLDRIDSVSNDLVSAKPNVSDIREVTVKGSKGNEYTVIVKGDVAISCTCPGFTYRKHCRHLKEVEAEIA